MSEDIKEIAQFDSNLIKSLENFMESYKMVDVDQVYSNGTEFVPIFRVKQWLAYNNITNLQTQLQQKENIIKEVREYLDIDESIRKNCKRYDVNGIAILEILDKENRL